MITNTKRHGYVEKGKLTILNRDRMTEDMRQFPDCDVEIVIKKKGKRSCQQNRYYWGVVVEEIRLNFLNRGYRYSAEDIHTMLKLKFNPDKVIIEGTGEVIDLPATTTELNKEAFSEYIEQIKEWAAESLDLYIPDANTQTTLY